MAEHSPVEDGIILGDSAYPSLPWLLTPYDQPENDVQRRYLLTFNGIHDSCLMGDFVKGKLMTRTSKEAAGCLMGEHFWRHPLQAGLNYWSDYNNTVFLATLRHWQFVPARSRCKLTWTFADTDQPHFWTLSIVYCHSSLPPGRQCGWFSRRFWI